MLQVGEQKDNIKRVDDVAGGAATESGKGEKCPPVLQRKENHIESCKIQDLKNY